MRLHPSLSAFGSKDKALLIYEQTDNEPRRQAVPRGTSSD